MPFENEMHAGAYDDLTLWEQIDDGAQYTPAKKWLFSVPVVLYVEKSLICGADMFQVPRIYSLHQL